MPWRPVIMMATGYRDCHEVESGQLYYRCRYRAQARAFETYSRAFETYSESYRRPAGHGFSLACGLDLGHDHFPPAGRGPGCSDHRYDIIPGGATVPLSGQPEGSGRFGLTPGPAPSPTHSVTRAWGLPDSGSDTSTTASN